MRSVAIAKNLRELRGGMSALELSRRSGVARNTIAALERGEGNPTIDTLYALADALGVPLAALLESAPASPLVVRAGAGTHVEGAALEAELLERFERPGVFGELYAIRFHAGRVREAPPHPFGVEERLHLLTGRVRVGPVGEAVELGPGDYAAYSGSVPHVYEALEDASGTLLMLTGRSSR
ncbi:XRE family transcriptional regulator [Solirubrobacter pauli]|uniref:XRE family transcriptional regulator n=1 Tax=Solirubrobacter pauli TaxID=166793 RepID=A0A660LC69_9ACTN|nr:XRE family transcriptional regulator [Solirubrobacter pauli]